MEDAERAYREAVRLKPDSLAGLAGLTRALIEQRRWPEVESTARAVIALNFESALAHFACGGRWRRRPSGRTSKPPPARSSTSVRITPTPTRGWATRCTSRDEYQGAEAAYAAAIQLGPDLPRFREGLARAQQARAVSARPGRRASRRARR